MNNIPYPYMPFGMPLPVPDKYEEEINNLKYETEKLKERVNNLENKNKKNYLQKDEGLYIM